MKLYYNANHPFEILSLLKIKTSFVTRNRGISMSNKPINCHGPFTFAFKEDRIWYSQFEPVQYSDKWEQIDFIHKQKMFENECEYWTKNEVDFSLDDIEYILFRNKSAGAKIHPIIAKRNYRRISELYPNLVMEM